MRNFVQKRSCPNRFRRCGVNTFQQILIAGLLRAIVSGLQNGNLQCLTNLLATKSLAADLLLPCGPPQTGFQDCSAAHVCQVIVSFLLSVIFFSLCVFNIFTRSMPCGKMSFWLKKNPLGI